ncbi:MAG TPA: type II toxin-antitoxin system prevent-host-death family antitoxin [Acidimicrobiales bacterium]|jgi:prevent-host-death family protein
MVTIRDLRNHGGEVVDRASQGESVIITRGGKAVAELRPLARPGLTAAALLVRWHRLPPTDPGELREDIDSVIDSSL